MYEVYNASGDLVYIISGDPGLLDVKVKNKSVNVEVDNEILNVSGESNCNISVQSGNPLPVSVVSQNASYNANDYSNILHDISNNSYMLVMGMLFIFIFKSVFSEIRGWR